MYSTEELFYKQKGGQKIDTAALKFTYVLGNDASFSQVKDVLKSSIRGVRSKKEI